jgi:hypothetical protein
MTTPSVNDNAATRALWTRGRVLAISVESDLAGNVQVARHALHWRGVHGRRPKCLSEVVANAASCPIASGGLVGRRGKDGGKDAVGVGGHPATGGPRCSTSSLLRLDVTR